MSLFVALSVVSLLRKYVGYRGIADSGKLFAQQIL